MDANRSIELLSRVGLQEDLDTFKALLMPFCNADEPSRLEATIGITGALMTRAGLPRSVVVLSVREMLRSQTLIEGREEFVVAVLNGTYLLMPTEAGADFFDVVSGQLHPGPIEQPLVTTVFNVSQVYRVCKD